MYHMIIHLEHTNEQQDFELTERAAVITSLSSRFRCYSFWCHQHPLWSPTPCQTSRRCRLQEVFGCG
jgi:hypothetical protein